MTIRRISHFLAIFAAGLITGGQYVVSFDYSTQGTTATLYTQKMQYAIHHIGTPLFSMLIATTILTFVTAILYRTDRKVCLLIAAAGVLFLSGGLITAFGNVPLLDAIDTWNVASPPSDWQEIADRWYRFHTVRIAVDVAGFALVTITAFLRHDERK
jgi:uncharacterized membrane protein